MSDDGGDQAGETATELVYESSTSEDSGHSDVSHHSTESSAATPSSSNGNFHCVPTVIDLGSLAHRTVKSDVIEEESPTQEDELPALEDEEISSDDQQEEDSYTEDTDSEPIRATNFSEAKSQTNETQETERSSIYQRRFEASVFCRICHEVGSADTFIAPCGCKGSLTLVHKHCLEIWLAESSLTQCEVCGYEYHTKRLPKHNIFGSIFAWIFASNNSRQRRLLCWDLFSMAILMPLAVMGTLLTSKVMSKEIPDSHPRSRLAYTRFLQLSMLLATLTLDAGVITWAMIRLQYHCLHWLRWYRTNFKVILVGFPDSQKAPVVNHVSSTTVREIHF